MAKVTNLIKFYTVFLLSQAPKHGYELIKELEAKLGRKVSASQIYPFLYSLRKEGYTTFGAIKEREKKVYSLTATGNKMVEQLLAHFDDIIKYTIERKVAKCTNCGCYIYRGGFKKLVKSKTKMFCCEHCACA